jgi:hypothetical protein
LVVAEAERNIRRDYGEALLQEMRADVIAAGDRSTALQEASACAYDSPAFQKAANDWLRPFCCGYEPTDKQRPNVWVDVGRTETRKI